MIVICSCFSSPEEVKDLIHLADFGILELIHLNGIWIIGNL